MTKHIQTTDGDDITEAVQILYDIAHSSMDWGSGFLDNDEMETVIGLAVLMGWKVPDLPYSLSMRSPMETVARKFPDHYEIEERQHPPSSYHPEGFVSYQIKTKTPCTRRSVSVVEAPLLGHENDCPECQQGKHQNCTEWAIDESTDQVVACDCATGGHI